MEVLWRGASVNREGCGLCATPKVPSGASEPAAAPEKTALSGGPKSEGREHSELGVLKTEYRMRHFTSAQAHQQFPARQAAR
jgi:hypothetical protein